MIQGHCWLSDGNDANLTANERSARFASARLLRMIPELDRNAPASGARSARSGLDRVRLLSGKLLAANAT